MFLTKEKTFEKTLSFTKKLLVTHRVRLIIAWEKMLPSDISLSIRSGTVGYHYKILLPDGTFSLGKNSKVNTLELAKGGDKPKISHKVVVQPSLIKP